MDPKQGGPDPIGNNPPPQIIKPGATSGGPVPANPVEPSLPIPGMAAADSPASSDMPEPPQPEPQPMPEPQPPQPIAPTAPEPTEPSPPESLMPPTSQTAAGTSFSTDDFSRPPQPPQSEPQPQPSLASTPAPDTSNLFQPDSKLPEIKYPGQDSVVVDNRPPRGLKRMFANPRRVFLISAPLVLILIIAGFVFGYYLPNRPGAVWNTGLDRSGKALDELLTQATDKSQLEQYKKSEIKATLDIKAQGNDLAGSFTGRFDDSKADGELKFTGKENGSASIDIGLKFISILADGATYPDSYIQLNGLKALGADSLAPGVSQYDGKWISVEAKYLESLGLPVPSADKKKNDSQINADDISEVIRTTSSVAKDYVFTSDKDKALIEERSFVGKEKVDGITAYHYKAGINKSHGDQFCTAYYTQLAGTNLYKKLNQNDQAKINKSRDDDIKTCKKDDIGSIKDSDTFDIWIGGKYKLIHKIRVTDDKNKNNYWEVGQDYNGGDEISLFSNYHETGNTPVDLNLNFTTNIKTVDSKGTFAINYGKGNDEWKGTASFEIKPLSGDLNIQKPANAIPIQTILKQYGFDSTGGYVDSAFSGQQAQAKDADRKSDINSIYSQLEVYNAENGYYPSLAQLNSSSWRAANMQGLDSSALAPPDSSASGLALTASHSQYGYNPSGCNSAGEKCSGFLLEALLDTGGKFTKYSSNLTITTTNPGNSSGTNLN